MINRMIIFEGHECAGKSTVVNALAEEFSAKIHKGVRIADRFQLLKNVVDDISTQLVRTSVGNGESLVLVDRWPAISDVIYEKYCYGSESIMESVLPNLKDIIRDANIQIVYLHTTQTEMIDRFCTRGDKLRTLDEAIRTHEAYGKFFNTETCPVDFISIDVTGCSIEETYNLVCEQLNLPIRELV